MKKLSSICSSDVFRTTGAGFTFAGGSDGCCLRTGGPRRPKIASNPSSDADTAFFILPLSLLASGMFERLATWRLLEMSKLPNTVCSLFCFRSTAFRFLDAALMPKKSSSESLASLAASAWLLRLDDVDEDVNQAGPDDFLFCDVDVFCDDVFDPLLLVSQMGSDDFLFCGDFFDGAYVFEPSLSSAAALLNQIGPDDFLFCGVDFFDEDDVFEPSLLADASLFNQRGFDDFLFCGDGVCGSSSSVSELLSSQRGFDFPFCFGGDFCLVLIYI